MVLSRSKGGAEKHRTAEKARKRRSGGKVRIENGSVAVMGQRQASRLLWTLSAFSLISFSKAYEYGYYVFMVMMQ